MCFMENDLFVVYSEDKGDGEMIEYDAISDDDLDDIIGRDGGSEGEELKPQKTGKFFKSWKNSNHRKLVQ